MRREELRRAIELPAQRAGLHVERELADALLADDDGRARGAPAAVDRAARALATPRRPPPAPAPPTSARAGCAARSPAGRDGLQRASTASSRRSRDACSCAWPATKASATPVRRRVAAGRARGRSRRSGRPRTRGAEPTAVCVTVSEGSAEVAHEALLHEWPRLRGWLQQDAEGRRLHRHLIHAAAEWSDGGRDRRRALPGRATGLRAGVARRARSRSSTPPSSSSSTPAGPRASAPAAGSGWRSPASRRCSSSRPPRRSWRSISGDRPRTQTQAAEAQRLGAQALNQETLDRSLLLARQGSRSTTRRPPGTTCWRLCIAARRPSA